LPDLGGLYEDGRRPFTYIRTCTPALPPVRMVTSPIDGAIRRICAHIFYSGTILCLEEALSSRRQVALDTGALQADRD